MVHGKRVYTRHDPSDDSRCLTQTSCDTVPFTPFVQLVTSTPMVSKRSAMSHQPSAPPVVAIIGRPNVGKSTLFNRALGARTAIVDDVPGVTRDRNYADGTYQGRAFRLVDTGGLDPSATDGMLSLIRRQSQLAIAEADILIFLMDGRAGLTPGDEEIVSLLRGVTKPAFYTINKIDTPQSETLQADFYRLGQETLYPLSAEAGTGVDELLEAILPLLPVSGEGAEPAEPPPRIAIVGRPNVGKSTLINTLLGQERMVVFELPGTTRDSVDTTVSHRRRSYIFTDTAGARRQYELDLRRRLPFLPWAPVLFGSALKPDSVSEVFPLVDQVVTAFTRRIPTGLLNKFLQEVIAENPLPVRKGKPGKAVKSVYVTQVATQPPVFALFVGHPEDVGPTYLRFLEHRLRERFEFLGTSIRILVRRK